MGGGTGRVPMVVTTSRKAGPSLEAEARQWADRLAVPFARRAGKPMAQLLSEAQVAAVLVIGEQWPVYLWPERDVEYFFHPSMAKIRLNNLAEGRGDPMVSAMDLGTGDAVLDCTLGRGSDAIVASSVVGPAGRVVGLEVVPIIAELTRHGLARYSFGKPQVDAALRRIAVHCVDHRDYLADCEDNAFDIVYFDPVFTRPLLDSDAMAPLRAVAQKDTVTRDLLAEATRVASRRVVVKDVVHSELWARLGIETVVRGAGSRIEFGVAEASQG